VNDVKRREDGLEQRGGRFDIHPPCRNPDEGGEGRRERKRSSGARVSQPQRPMKAGWRTLAALQQPVGRVVVSIGLDMMCEMLESGVASGLA